MEVKFINYSQETLFANKLFFNSQCRFMLRARKLATIFSKTFWSKVHFCTTEPLPDEPPISLYEKFKGFRNTALEGVNLPGVTIVNSREKALRALDVLMSLEDRYFNEFTLILTIKNKEYMHGIQKLLILKLKNKVLLGMERLLVLKHFVDLK